MKKILFTLMSFVIICGMNNASPLFAQTENTEYQDVAEQIIDRIKGLEEIFPHFESVEENATVSEQVDPFWVAFEYRNGVKTLVDDETQQERTTFSEEQGINVALYFYEGAWQGEGQVKPFTFGEMNLLVVVEGAPTEEVQTIRATIGQIVLDEKKSFEMKQK